MDISITKVIAFIVMPIVLIIGAVIWVIGIQENRVTVSGEVAAIVVYDEFDFSTLTFAIEKRWFGDSRVMKNPQIQADTPNKSGTQTITLKVNEEGKKKTFTVQVQVTVLARQLADVTSASFSDRTVSWQEVQYATNYTLYFNDTQIYLGEDSFFDLDYTYDIVNTDEFKVVASGDPSIVIQSNGYIFEAQVAPTVTNLQVVDNTLMFVCDSEIDEYKVYIDNALYKTTTSKSIALTNIAAGEHSIMVCSAQTGKLSAASDILSITKLAAPTVTRSGSTASASSVQGASDYQLIINDMLVNGQSYSSFAAGSNTVKAKALGNGSDVLDSEESELISFNKYFNVSSLQYSASGNYLYVAIIDTQNSNVTYAVTYTKHYTSGSSISDTYVGNVLNDSSKIMTFTLNGGVNSIDIYITVKGDGVDSETIKFTWNL